ncbi:hypothetical protein F5Y16DRAFT_400863 [Xylariaceae sp. FL0255]|nr:hypothetical protein F5Y16DRAFT_400863 [Xylariaceae sp. FL0255]
MDFDAVSHHTVQGSMMGSPASTAAYLIHASQWDDEAEAYLRGVLNCGPGHGNGGMPSAYPSHYFEYAWVLSTLLYSGFLASDLASAALTTNTDGIEQAFASEGGVIGFAPCTEPDVDDTVKDIISLNSLGHIVNMGKILELFEVDDHFRTYALERDPSFSANCNALSALLCHPDAKCYTPQILKAVTFICNHAWGCHGHIMDRWNLSPLYTSLLSMQSLAEFLYQAEGGRLSGVLNGDMEYRLAIVMLRACLSTLLSQRDNGSWNDAAEDSLRYPHPQRGQKITLCSRSQDTAKLMYRPWKKVTYSSPILTDAYVLAALKVVSLLVRRAVGPAIDSTSASTLQKYMQILKKTRLFYGVSPQIVKQPMYLALIPLTWTSCNIKTRTFASAAFILDMIVISFLNYLADEFMEFAADSAFGGDIEDLRDLIKEAVHQAARRSGSGNDNANGTTNSISSDPSETYSVLYRFAKFVLYYPAVLAASEWDSNNLKVILSWS